MLWPTRLGDGLRHMGPPHQPVTADAVERMSAEKLDLAKKVLVDVIPRIPDSLGEKCSREMANACI